MDLNTHKIDEVLPLSEGKLRIVARRRDDNGMGILMDDGRIIWIFPADMKQLHGKDYRDAFDFATATVLANLIRRDHPEWSPRVEGYTDYARAMGIGGCSFYVFGGFVIWLVSLTLIWGHQHHRTCHET